MSAFHSSNIRCFQRFIQLGPAYFSTSYSYGLVLAPRAWPLLKQRGHLGVSTENSKYFTTVPLPCQSLNSNIFLTCIRWLVKSTQF